MQTFQITNERVKKSNKIPKQKQRQKMTEHKPPRCKNLGIIVGKRWRGVNVGVIPTVVLFLHCFCDEGNLTERDYF